MEKYVIYSTTGSVKVCDHLTLREVVEVPSRKARRQIDSYESNPMDIELHCQVCDVVYPIVRLY